MNSFRIKNTKAFLDSDEINIKPITILVGQNSCGKSSLLRFPAVLAQTANNFGSTPPVSLFGENVDYGNFQDIVYGKNGNEISFSLCYSVDITGNTQVSTDPGGTRLMVKRRKTNGQVSEQVFKDATISVTLRWSNRSINVHRVDMSIEEYPVSSLCWNEEKKQYILSLLSMYENNELIRVNETIALSSEYVSFEKFFPIYEGDVLEAILSSNNLELSMDQKRSILKYHLFQSVKADIKNDLSETELKMARVYSIFEFSADIMRSLYCSFNIECKNNIAYIGPFRKNPDRIHRSSEAIKLHVGAKGENMADILARAYRADDKTLYDKISELIEDYFGYKLIINDLGSNFFQVMLKDQSGIEANLIDVGFGISQVLPIILETCLSSEKKQKRTADLGINNIILVEQPELHLHPAAQARLAELFAMCVNANPNARFIIETHSEHLISKLQVLIADTECPLNSDMVQILYVDKDDQGCAFVEEMRIKENGKFEKEWPTGFFDQGYSLAKQLMRVSSQRGKK